MFTDRDLMNLVDQAGVLPMANGWRVVIRADWVDATPQQPHGLDYALILQDEHGNRLFGIDNSHGFDGAEEVDRWDHIHKTGRVGQRFRYDFVSAAALIDFFFERVSSYCAECSVSAEFLDY